MAATQHSSPPPNLFNIVEHNHNHLKHKSKHGEQGDEEQQEVFDYSHHDDEPPETSCGSSRASLSSSPSHEFSFTVCSLYTSPPSSTTSSNTNNVLKDSFTNTSSSTASSAVATAIDLSPADEIFFHGHLLPLHLLSGGHLSISPRSSTNSLDSFTVPITSHFSNPNNNDSSMDYQAVQDRALDNMEKPKSRSFSLFRNRTTTVKSRKSPENQETEENRSSKPHHDNDHHKNNLNKVKFELTNAIKLVRSLLIFKQGNNSNNNSGRKGGIQMRGVHQTFSYSGNLSSPRIRSNKQGAEVLRGRFSAPATTRTSPTNSGMMFLEGGSRNNSSSSSSSCNSDSTMEELQAAIQAAIAHCKNSSIAAAAAVQDKI
ncbi:unnamed protein product [Rhodiola kirilowii]